jgi:SAM-dependent methyltransferase
VSDPNVARDVQRRVIDLHKMTDPKELVSTGYDKVSYAYREDDPDPSGEEFRRYGSWIEELIDLLPEGASVLDLGCGCGVPATKMLAEHFAVTGVDISRVQIERARRLVPKADFMCADMSALGFDAGFFDAIVCLYSIIHVPLSEQRPLLEGMGRWLKEGGYLLISVGHTAWTGLENDWLDVNGATMYWSHADRDTYLNWLTSIGFQVVWERFIPEGDGGHPLFMLRADFPSSRSGRNTSI